MAQDKNDVFLGFLSPGDEMDVKMPLLSNSPFTNSDDPFTKYDEEICGDTFRQTDPRPIEIWNAAQTLLDQADGVSDPWVDFGWSSPHVDMDADTEMVPAIKTTSSPACRPDKSHTTGATFPSPPGGISQLQNSQNSGLKHTTEICLQPSPCFVNKTTCPKPLDTGRTIMPGMLVRRSQFVNNASSMFPKPNVRIPRTLEPQYPSTQDVGHGQTKERHETNETAKSKVSSCHGTGSGLSSRPWGSLVLTGQPLFSYTPKGQWLLDRCFTGSQLREYVMTCPGDTMFWLQQAPTRCAQRLDPEDTICRWTGCPAPFRKIQSGWLRVAFDECSGLTTNGTKDPLKVAGSLHLWCFEQVFDPLEFHMTGKLCPERRKFPNELKSRVTLERPADAGIIMEAYLPWMVAKTKEWTRNGLLHLTRPHQESLSYAMVKYHLDNQKASRQKAREARNARAGRAQGRMIDDHMGDLGFYARACREAKFSKKRSRRGELAQGATAKSA